MRWKKSQNQNMKGCRKRTSMFYSWLDLFVCMHFFACPYFCELNEIPKCGHSLAGRNMSKFGVRTENKKKGRKKGESILEGIWVTRKRIYSLHPSFALFGLLWEKKMALFLRNVQPSIARCPVRRAKFPKYLFSDSETSSCLNTKSYGCLFRTLHTSKIGWFLVAVLVTFSLARSPSEYEWLFAK